MYGRPYTDSGSAIDLFVSCISHVSTLHAAKNASLLAFCVIVLWHYDVRARWLSTLAFAAPVNYGLAHAVGPVAGASGGTFALLGVVTVVAYERHSALTVIALVPLAFHQVAFGIPEIAAAHTVAWIVGVSAKRVSTGNTPNHVLRRSMPIQQAWKRGS